MIFTISNERASISTHKKYFKRIVVDFSAKVLKVCTFLECRNLFSLLCPMKHDNVNCTDAKNKVF